MLEDQHHKVIDQYLKHYAEWDIDDIELTEQYQHVLVIPAFAEHPRNLEACWAKVSKNCLIIVVINAPAPEQRTLALLSYFHEHYALKTSGSYWSHFQQDALPDLLILNRCTQGLYLPVKQGVGLARKIGADIALKLIRRGQIQKPIIYNTDADARLPADYFNRKLDETSAASVYPFRHRLPEATEPRRAILKYELKLHHYRAGLAWAGSSYAHDSLGSLIAVRAKAYAQVRGFPKRPTGEDFYLLNKLVKVGGVQTLTGPRIVLSARPSTRVPVGTGTAIISLQQLSLDAPYYYAPANFYRLKSLLSAMQSTSDGEDIETQLDDASSGFLKAMGFSEILLKLSTNTKSPEQLRRAINEWFDGFKQLKFLHYLRDHQSPNVDLRVILQSPWIQDPTFSGLSPERFRMLKNFTSSH